MLAVAALVGAGCAHAGGSGSTSRAATPATPAVSNRTAPAAAPPRTGRAQRHRTPRRSSLVVGERVLTFVDRSRLIRLPSGRLEPRTLVTLVRYPALGAAGRADASGAPADRAGGPFPLVVFGHGFAVTPAPYAQLLRAWTRAGYVVAAPVFPRENAGAPGGPEEADLVNQPGDMSFVISSLLAAAAGPHSPLAGLIDPHRIAAAGQSDGGETALAVTYDHRFRDRRIGVAMILSGAEIPGVGGFQFPAHSPPLLATQGTADTINPPSHTRAFFDIAPAPKYLLTMFGASHLGPYTDGQPQLGIVERVTIAFLDRYLKPRPAAGARLLKAGDVPGTSVIEADR